MIISSYSINIYSQSIGLKGGVNFTNMHEESDFGEFSTNYKYLTGYNLGVFIEIPSNGIVLETGLFINTRGFKLDEEDAVQETAVKVEYSTLYLDLPIKAKVVTLLWPDLISLQLEAYMGHMDFQELVTVSLPI